MSILGKLAATLELENAKCQSALLKSDYNAHHYSSNMWAFLSAVSARPFLKNSVKKI